MTKRTQPCEREYDFALIVDGVADLTDEVVNALFEAGCDDATPSMQYGRLYLEFSRSAPSLKDAIVSAVQNVYRSGLPVQVLRVDECNLVTAAEIARRIERSRQMVHQYMTGKRGPGGFPPPCCHLAEHAPLWQWCAVSYWLVENDLIREEAFEEAEVIDAINDALEETQHPEGYRKLVSEVARDIDPKR